jgi:dTDP-4-dehydrorhamnose reductase
MKIMVLGAGGMLGHRLWHRLSQKHKLIGTCRNSIPWLEERISESRDIISGVNAFNIDTIADALDKQKPELLINCIGVIKQLPEGDDPVITIAINSLLPHQLAALCKQRGIRLLHISTDCVFSGDKGGYLESDLPDAVDLYGQSKALGEIKSADSLTIRISIIGHELKNKLSLLEWFLAQSESVNGFSGVLYNGLTTTELSNVIENYVIPRPEINGLYQVASSAVNKNDLLHIIRDIYGNNVDILACANPVNDKTIIGDRFAKLTGYRVPDWRQMIIEMHEDFLESAR